MATKMGKKRNRAASAHLDQGASLQLFQPLNAYIFSLKAIIQFIENVWKQGNLLFQFNARERDKLFLTVLNAVRCLDAKVIILLILIGDDRARTPPDVVKDQ